MPSFRNILVDIDATATSHPALERAVVLARRTGAALTISDVMTVPAHARHYLPAGVEESLVETRRAQLAAVAATVTDIQATPKLLIGRPATVLIEEVLRSRHDLIMRSHARDVVTTGPRLFGAVDMELLRKCPCPVLLARHGHPAPTPRIACAVDASADDAETQHLNAKIVRVALTMAESLESEPPTLFHAWVPFAERLVRTHTGEDQFAGYLERARQRAAATLREVARVSGGGVDEARIVLRRGEPDEAIPEFVVSEGVDLLVMGTVARAGIPGLLIGNTAERVLRKLPCSVLTIKPDGFVSPVRLGSD
jgi:nucleotide-binding universal stress UspA family protein